MYYLGLDIGATKMVVTAAELEDNLLQILYGMTEPTTESPCQAAISEQAIDMTKRVLRDTGIEPSDVTAYGISSVGPLWERHSIWDSPNLKAKGILPVVHPIQEAFGFGGIRISNDANAAALFEYMFRGENFKNILSLLYVTLSSGIGAGGVFDGRLLEGKHGNALEYGHITVAPPDYLERYGMGKRICGCKRRGCLEAYGSANSVMFIAGEILNRLDQNGWLPKYWRNPRYSSSDGNFDSNKVKTADVFEAARSGDRVASDIIDGTLEILAREFGNLINLFDPDAIFIGGGMSRQGEEYLFEPLRQRINALPALQKGVHIGSSQFGYNIGAIAPYALVLPHGRYVCDASALESLLTTY